MNYLTAQPEVMLAQADANLERDTSFFVGVEPHNGTALIVGGGPSLADSMPDLRARSKRGGIVFAVNGTHDWLLDRGLVPSFHVMGDARAENVEFVRQPHKGCTYLVAAQCHPDVFEALDGYAVIQWVAWVKGIEEVAERHQDRPIVIVGGGNTTGLKAMILAQLWGFRKMHLYGFDSCYSATGHAYPQALNDGEKVKEVSYAGKTFTAARWMIKQADDFKTEAAGLEKLGVRIIVHGDGLIPWMYKQMERV